VVDFQATHVLVEVCRSDRQFVPVDDLANQPLDSARVIDLAEEVAKDVRVHIPILFLVSRPTPASPTLYLGFLGSKGRRGRRQRVGLRFSDPEWRGGLFWPINFWLHVEGRGEGIVGGAVVERRTEREEGHVGLVEHGHVVAGRVWRAEGQVLHD
jgi:aryl carrier-like protein